MHFELSSKSSRTSLRLFGFLQRTIFQMKSALAALALAATVSSQYNETVNVSDCKCFPGDDCWPTAEEWNQFNNTVHGRLIATVPLATPCHGTSYDNVTCTKLQNAWLDPETQ
jgi:hypothetical protein